MIHMFHFFATHEFFVSVSVCDSCLVVRQRHHSIASVEVFRRQPTENATQTRHHKPAKFTGHVLVDNKPEAHLLWQPCISSGPNMQMEQRSARVSFSCHADLSEARKWMHRQLASPASRSANQCWLQACGNATRSRIQIDRFHANGVAFGLISVACRIRSVPRPMGWCATPTRQRRRTTCVPWKSMTFRICLRNLIA